MLSVDIRPLISFKMKKIKSMNITISKYTVEFDPFWSSLGPGTGEFHKIKGFPGIIPLMGNNRLEVSFH